MYRCRTPAELRSFWRIYFRTHFAGPGEDLKPSTGGPLAAYVNHGRWVADCPLCGAGIAVAVDGAVGCCLECGIEYEIQVPPDSVIEEATPILLARPTRGPHRIRANWYPFPGVFGAVLALKAETPADLALENELHMGAV